MIRTLLISVAACTSLTSSAAAQTAAPPAGQSDAKAAAAPAPKDTALQAELIRRVKEDQAVRQAFIAYLRKQAGGSVKRAKMADPPEIEHMRKVDDDNRTWLKSVIHRTGWPGKSLVGADGAHDAWLLVQHCDDDLKFQERCLRLMEAAVAKGEATRLDLAYLTDRVLVNEHKPQIYGTQTRQVGGEYVPAPIEEEALVDERRKAVGLPPMAVYMQQIRELYIGKKASAGQTADQGNRP